uniref:SMI1/KNR4 family protein n=1 Tax=Stappia sp. TaxID=1870903 RepID=UPI003BAB2AE2
MSEIPSVSVPHFDNLEKLARSSLVQQRFGGADMKRISAFEERYGVTFSDAYRRFLTRENGLDICIPLETVEALPSNAQSDGFVLWDINTLFGLGNGHPYHDLERLAPDMGFHDYELTPFAHVIALGGDFCTLVEIIRGSHAGKIIYTDGELFHGLPRNEILCKTDDEAFDYLTDLGYYMPIADNLDDLWEKYVRLV